jgi:hypothetical protein
MTVNTAHRATGVAIDRENREKDDFYPTPPEATEALLAVEAFAGAIWEPACGDGAICKVLLRHGYETVATDLVDRGYGIARRDFLMEFQASAPNIITNPPFKLINEFIKQALFLTTGKVGILARLACLEGGERRQIFDTSPLARVWVFSRRLSMYRNGENTGNGGTIAFAWFVWEHGHVGRPTLGWL